MDFLKGSFLAIFISLTFFIFRNNAPVGNSFGSIFSKNNENEVKNVIFQSDDLGITWKDVSYGLKGNPENIELFTNGDELFLQTDSEVYQKSSSKTQNPWEKEYDSEKLGKVWVCKSGVYGVHYNGQIFKLKPETDTWAPIFNNFGLSKLRSLFESPNGTFFLGSDNGLYKSFDRGITWKHVPQSSVGKIVEINGVLVATSQSGIIRSTNDGQSWEKVIQEGGVGIDITKINGGIAAISYNRSSKTRRIRASYDSGKTWQNIDEGLPPHDLIASIVQVGNALFVGHPKGIYKSADKGKTWEFITPSIDDKVFNLHVSGNTIYAIPRFGGC